MIETAESHSKVTLDKVSFEHLSITLRGGNEANSEKMVHSAQLSTLQYHGMRCSIELAWMSLNWLLNCQYGPLVSKCVGIPFP